MAVDILPQAIYITKADVTDRNAAIEMFIATSDNLGRVQNMLVDSGYSGDKFAAVGKKFLPAAVKL